MAKMALPLPPLSSLVILFRFLGHLQWPGGEEAASPSQRQSNGNEHSWLPVFSPSHVPTLFQTKELQRPLNSTLGVRSAKTRAQCSYALKTATRELATPEDHSSQPQPLQPLSLLPTSLLAVAVVSPPTHHAVLSFPVQIRGPVRLSAAVRAQASVVHSQCCEMRGFPKTDSDLF